jgi:hypothetical protein
MSNKFLKFEYFYYNGIVSGIFPEFWIGSRNYSSDIDYQNRILPQQLSNSKKEHLFLPPASIQ